MTVGGDDSTCGRSGRGIPDRWGLREDDHEIGSDGQFESEISRCISEYFRVRDESLIDFTPYRPRADSL